MGRNEVIEQEIRKIEGLIEELCRKHSEALTKETFIHDLSLPWEELKIVTYGFCLSKSMEVKNRGLHLPQTKTTKITYKMNSIC